MQRAGNDVFRIFFMILVITFVGVASMFLVTFTGAFTIFLFIIVLVTLITGLVNLFTTFVFTLKIIFCIVFVASGNRASCGQRVMFKDNDYL